METVKPTIHSTVYSRMVGDLANRAPRFSMEDDMLFWSDWDGTTYQVNLGEIR